uniref:Protein LEG1 homolog n=1 Tax=Stegastes partitus TaxID=144197 RepID=A0A3B4ZRZ8_9TELE
MQRPAVLGLLLACAASLCSSTQVTKNGSPLGWDETVGQMSELSTQDGTVTPNPWHFPDRMSLYRLMIGATDQYMGSMGTNATDSPLWGLALQLAWLYNSGRLADPTASTTCGQATDKSCISPQSWWSCENYYTSVLPFLSAVQQGFLGSDVQVLKVPEGVTDYCTTYTDCTTRFPDAMKGWDDFFKGLKAAAESTQPDNEKKDTILGQYWAAQMASLAATTGCNAKQSHYPSEEVSFANSWLSGADYLAAAHFQTNMERAEKFVVPLPARVLKKDDSAPYIEDLSAEENHTVYIFSWMKRINTMLFGTLLRLWKSAMCSVSTREKGRELLEQLLLNPSFATASFMSIIKDMSSSC